MATLSIQSLEKAYREFKAVDKASLEVRQSEFVALLGPSGCGKTTMLRMIAGFVGPSGGKILIGDRDVTQTPPHMRNTAMVFQSYALFPHMTVAENVGFGLRMRDCPKAEVEAKSLEALKLVQLMHLSERYPRELSGGQQQRVAVARALVVRPDVFLLDEPLSNLDAKLRQSVGLEMRALQQSLGLTTIFVTHDQAEALALADKVVIMNQGKIIQVGSPAEVYNRPVNTFVANFLGRANLLPGRVTQEGQFAADAGITVYCSTSGRRVGDRAVLCVRPENVTLGTSACTFANHFEARRTAKTYLGATTEHVVQLSTSGIELLIHASSSFEPAESTVNATGICDVGWNPDSALLLPE